MELTPRDSLFSWAGLFFWVALSFAAAGIGSRFWPGDWYAHLAKPAINPPAWVFAPVWTPLYLVMGIAAWLVWQERGLARAAPALALFLAQLALNAAWFWLFFGLHLLGWALVDLAALWLAIGATILAFWAHRPLAGLLLVPYLLWVSFAALLNFHLWRLNS
ncbi:MAG: TspO/MBR family protein [Desulfobaccales bacterium]